jgi:hypothetical protein
VLLAGPEFIARWPLPKPSEKMLKKFAWFSKKTAARFPLPQKIDMGDQLEGFYGQHRSGWSYALRFLSCLQAANGIWLDSFVERTFCWHPRGPRANLQPWIGFIHIPPHVPEWFQSEQSNDSIFRTDLWKQSLPFCQGLFTFSRYHRLSLEKKLALPINNLLFPTEEPDLKWSWERFAANREKKVVQVGWWLRKLHTIFMLPTRSYKKIFLRITHADLDGLLRRERSILVQQGKFADTMYDTVEQILYIPHKAYDRLLAENIVIMDLYDSSANNTIVECIVRRTPLLINRLDAVVEYLGEEYPLYFSSLEEAAAKMENRDLLFAAHQYLDALPIRRQLSGECFLKSFANSKIYQSLPSIIN